MSDLVAAAWAALKENQFATGGVVLMLLGGALAICLRLPWQVLALVRRRLVLTVEVRSGDEAFYWLQYWLSQQPYGRKARSLIGTVRRRSPHDDGTEDDDDLERMTCLARGGVPRRQRPTIHLVPGPGRHVFWLGRVLVHLDRHEVERVASDHDARERLVLTLVGFGDKRAVVRQVFDAARDAVFPPEDSSISVFSWQDAWLRVASSEERPVTTVVLPEGTAERVVADARAFLASRQWYRDRCVPWRRGYLFEGTPGSGKTSLVHAMATELALDVYHLRTTSFSTDEVLARAIAAVPERAILLVEDVDCAFAGREVVKGSAGAVTFSGVLNALDGLSASQGRILCMTTNHPERLDPALVRPGRVDVRVRFGPATREQAEALFHRFFPTASRELAARFASRLGENDSVAALQERLLLAKDDPRAALANAGETGAVRAELRAHSSESVPSQSEVRTS